MLGYLRNVPRPKDASRLSPGELLRMSLAACLEEEGPRAPGEEPGQAPPIRTWAGTHTATFTRGPRQEDPMWEEGPGDPADRQLHPPLTPPWPMLDSSLVSSAGPVHQEEGGGLCEGPPGCHSRCRAEKAGGDPAPSPPSSQSPKDPSPLQRAPPPPPPPKMGLTGPLQVPKARIGGGSWRPSCNQPQEWLPSPWEGS